MDIARPNDGLEGLAPVEPREPAGIHAERAASEVSGLHDRCACLGLEGARQGCPTRAEGHTASLIGSPSASRRRIDHLRVRFERFQWLAAPFPTHFPCLRPQNSGSPGFLALVLWRYWRYLFVRRFAVASAERFSSWPGVSGTSPAQLGQARPLRSPARKARQTNKRCCKALSHVSEKQQYQNPVRLVNKLSIFPYRAPWSLTGRFRRARPPISSTESRINAHRPAAKDRLCFSFGGL
jgi:hypothetical protein